MQARWVGAVHLIFIFIALKEKVDTYSLAPYSLAKYVKHLNTKPPVVVVVDVNKKATPDHDSGHYHSDGNYYNHGKKESDSKNEHYEKEYYHSDGKYYYHGKKKLNTQSEYGDPEYYHPKDNYHHHGKKKQNSKKYYYPVHYNYDGYYHDHVKMERNSLNDEEDYNPYDDKNSYNGFLKYYSKIEPEEENREYENNKEESNLISILNNRAEGNMKDDRETNRYREATSDETAKEHHLIHRLKDMVTQLKHNKELKSAKNSEDELSNAKTSRMDKVHLLNHILKVATGRESYGRLPASVLREAIISYENCVRKQKGSMRTVFCGINDELYKKDKKKRINDSEPQWGDCGGRDHCEEKQHEKKGKGTGRTMPPELKNTIIHTAIPNDSSRLLSRIYKKVAEKAKPIVLVLDTANLESVAESARFKPRSALKSNRNTSIEPFLSLYQLGQKSSMPKKVRFAERIQNNQDAYEHPELRIGTRYRAKNQEIKNIFKKQSNIKGASSKTYKNDRYKDGADNAKKYLIREDLKTMLKTSRGLSSYLRIPNIARGGDDKSCSSNSVEDNREEKLCREYIRKASECTGINFGAFQANKSGKMDVKLPSTVGGVLLHEIDWN